MKKLLALVLCVMLFVSVIPTAAFADGTSVSGSAIDLSPAYTARNTLYNALGILAGAHMYKNAITGIRSYETSKTKSLFESDTLKDETKPIDKLYMALTTLAAKDPTTGGANSYYGLAKLIAPVVVEAYNLAGNIAVGLTAAAIGSKDSAYGDLNSKTGYTKGSQIDTVLTSVNNIVASFTPAT